MAPDRATTIMMDQTKLKNFLLKRLERVEDAIGEKVVTDKGDAIRMKELEKDMIGVQDHLIRLQERLKEQQQETTDAGEERQKAHDKLAVVKNMYETMAEKLKKEKAHVSELEARAERLGQHLIYAQGVNDDLLSKGKTVQNLTSKAGAEKIQAKLNKLKQEIYVSRLTKHLEKVKEQGAVYQLHARAQARQTQELQQVLAETESAKSSLEMEYNQLFHQWNQSLLALRKQDEAFSDIQVAVNKAKVDVTTIHWEIDGYHKTIKEEKEKLNVLKTKLERAKMEIAVSTTLIDQLEAKKEELQAQCSTSLGILKETELSRDAVQKEIRALLVDLNNNRKMLEKDSTLRIELEGKIMTQMQQKLIHSNLAQQPTSALNAIKKEKVGQLLQLEQDYNVLEHECNEVIHRLDNLKNTKDTLDKSISKNDRLITASQGVLNGLQLAIRQNHAYIDINNKKLQQLKERNGILQNDMLSPLQIQADALAKKIEVMSESNMKSRQQWERQQGLLLQLAQEKKTYTTEFLDYQTKYCVLNQKKIRIESQIEQEQRQQVELVRELKTLMSDRVKLNSLMSKNTQLTQALELENALKESDNLCKLKEAERERVELKMKQERIEEEKGILKSYLVEADMQIGLWERKIQLLRETRAAVDYEREDIDGMKAEVHQKEVRLNQLRRQQLDLQRESGQAFARRESVLLYRDVMVQSLRKQATSKKADEYCSTVLVIKGLKRRLKNKHKEVAGTEHRIRELQGRKDALNNSIDRQRKHIIDLKARNCALDEEIMKLEDDKDRNLFVLVALQNRAKQLQMVCEGKFQGGNGSSESVDSALERHEEFVLATSNVLQNVCEEFSQYRAVLRRPLLLLEAQRELSKV